MGQDDEAATATRYAAVGIAMTGGMVSVVTMTMIVMIIVISIESDHDGCAVSPLIYAHTRVRHHTRREKRAGDQS